MLKGRVMKPVSTVSLSQGESTAQDAEEAFIGPGHICTEELL